MKLANVRMFVLLLLVFQVYFSIDPECVIAIYHLSTQPKPHFPNMLAKPILMNSLNLINTNRLLTIVTLVISRPLAKRNIEGRVIIERERVKERGIASCRSPHPRSRP
jgi:hypothetical protein